MSTQSPHRPALQATGAPIQAKRPALQATGAPIAGAPIAGAPIAGAPIAERRPTALWSFVLTYLILKAGATIALIAHLATR